MHKGDGHPMSAPLRVLLVEDSPADARLVEEMIKDASAESRHPFSLYRAGTLAEALKALGQVRPDAILTDLALPDSIGLETFLRLRSRAQGVPIVVLTGLADEDLGIRAVKEGAQDYLVKGRVDGGIIVRAVRYAVERQRGAPSRQRANPATGGTGRPAVEMVGASGAIRAVAGLVATVARTSRTSVLIQGETGTGKELIANSIHYLSDRRDGPFIKLNCSAIPDTLLETEMFGYEKGAFTDARQAKIGLFELADGGTIFLDEVGDMDLRLQPKLLHVIEDRTLRRVGGLRDAQVDVRVIAATNKVLDAMVREKRFREDLYYRLNVMAINVPPLRERREDIIPLAEHYLMEGSQASGAGARALSDECGRAFLAYSWPGNVRELKNAVERALILAGSGEILPEHLPREVVSGKANDRAHLDLFCSPPGRLDEMERNYIIHVLGKVNGNKTRAAEILGISRLTLREKLKRGAAKAS
jgi:DNA-binding NtrC family response regulator